jgi:hypothetical protein
MTRAAPSITVAFAQFGRIFAALGAGRHSDAYELHPATN